MGLIRYILTLLATLFLVNVEINLASLLIPYFLLPRSLCTSSKFDFLGGSASSPDLASSTAFRVFLCRFINFHLLFLLSLVS